MVVLGGVFGGAVVLSHFDVFNRCGGGVAEREKGKPWEKENVGSDKLIMGWVVRTGFEKEI